MFPAPAEERRGHRKCSTAASEANQPVVLTVGDMTNLTRQLRLDEFSTNEMLALLSSQFSLSKIDGSSGHVVVFGDNEVLVTFKSGERRIREIEASSRLSPAALAQLIEKVGSALDEGAPWDVSSKAVMSVGPYDRPPIRWADRWQLGRMPEETSQQFVLTAHHPVLFQHRYRKVGIGMLDRVRREAAFRRAFLPLVPIMHRWKTGLVDTSGSHVRHAWVVVDGGETTPLSSRWAQLQYIIPEDLLSGGLYGFDSPPALDVETGAPAGTFLAELRGWLLRFERLEPEAQDKFLRGCYWFNKALTTASRTERLLALVIMVESFLAKESGACEKCGQSVHSVGSRFRSFLARHAGPSPAADADEHERYKRFTGNLYALRSKVAHEGLAVAAEDLGVGIGFVPVDFGQQALVSDLQHVGSTLLLSWLREQTTPSPPPAA